MDDKTFSEIWEKEAKWLSGPQILSLIVDEFRGKSLIIAVNKDKPSGLIVSLPLETVKTASGKDMYKAMFMIPEPLRDIFQQCLNDIIQNNAHRIRYCTDRYIGLVVNDRLIAEINQDLRNLERDNELEGAQTLVDIAERAFGLPNRFADSYRNAKDNLAKFRADRRFVDPLLKRMLQ
jgi:hypothetical protein